MGQENSCPFTPECSVSFPDKETLHLHIQTIHTCRFCGKTSPEVSALEQHIQTCDFKNKPLTVLPKPDSQGGDKKSGAPSTPKPLEPQSVRYYDFKLQSDRAVTSFGSSTATTTLESLAYLRQCLIDKLCSRCVMCLVLHWKPDYRC